MFLQINFADFFHFSKMKKVFSKNLLVQTSKIFSPPKWEKSLVVSFGEIERRKISKISLS